MTTRSLPLAIRFLVLSVALFTGAHATLADDINTHEATFATHTSTYNDLYAIAQASRGAAITLLSNDLNTLATAATTTITDTGDTVDGSNIISGGNITGDDKTNLEALLDSIDALLVRTDIADTFTTHEGTYDALLVTFDELLELQGSNRLTQATEDDIATDLSTLKTNITTLITDNSGTVVDDVVAGLSSPEQDSLQTLLTNTQTLRDRQTDWTAIAAIQDATITGIFELKGLVTRTASGQTIAELETANDLVISNAKTNSDAAAQLIAAQAIITAGVGEIGGLATTASQTEFDFELDRLELLADTDQLFDLIEALPALNTALLNAVAATPSPCDETTNFYDTDFNAAQDTIESTASALITATDLVIAKAIALVATEQSGDDAHGDQIVTLAEDIEAIGESFKREARKFLSNVALARAEVNLREKQRQLLFDATPATRATLKSAVATAYTEVATNNMSLAETFALLNELIAESTITFPDTPIPVDEIEERIVTSVNEKVDTTLQNIQTLLGNDAIPATASTNGVARMKPLFLVEATLETMYLYATLSKANSAHKRLAAAAPEDKITTIDGLEAEWNKYGELLNGYILDAQVDQTHNGTTKNLHDVVWAITNPEATSSNATKYQNFFLSGSTPLRETSKMVAYFQTNSRRLSTLVKLKMLRDAQKVRSKVFSTILTEARDTNTVSAPATYDTGVLDARNTDPERTADDFDAEKIIDGDFTIRDDNPLEAGDEIFIAGADNNVDDPIIDAALDKLTADLKFVLKEGGRIGLGAANISTKSGGASPNVLGGTGDEVNAIQIVPDGTCYINLNGDVFITGSRPLIPTGNFGRGATHQIVFHSKNEAVIRVGRNVTWDLTSFANTKSGVESGTDFTDSATYGENSKQIVFAGKTRLVLEPGAKIKFPKVENGNASKSLVLYFNDDASMICEADQGNTNTRFEGSTLTGTDCIRNKIYGMGQVWFNGDATMQINKNAILGIESNHNTALTDITFEFQDRSQLLIGNNSQDGGALQIGNMFWGGSKTNPHSSDPDVNFPNTSLNSDVDFVPVKTFVNFTLKLNGSGAKCVIGRNGFFGLGAGIINKHRTLDETQDLIAGPINGTGNDDAWQLQRLYNVGSCTIDITKGAFEHCQIAAGSDSAASLFACGPFTNYPAGKYLLKLGKPTEAFLCGGGNMLMLSKDASMAIDGDGDLVAAPHDANIGSLRTRVTVDTLGTLNTGRYGIMAPAPLLRKRWINGLLLGNYRTYGRAWVQPTNDAYVFAGPQEEFFDAMTMRHIKDDADKIIPIGYGGALSNYAYAYVKDNAIIRKSTAIPSMRFIGSTRSPESVLLEATSPGYVQVNSLTAAGDPIDFKF